MSKVICLETRDKSGRFGVEYTGRAEIFDNWEEKDKNCSFGQFTVNDLVRYQDGFQGIIPGNLEEVREILRENNIEY